MDVEVFNLVGLLVLGNNVQEFSKAVLFKIFLSEVLEISLGEGDGCADANFSSVFSNFDIVTEFADFAVDFDSFSKILSKARSNEDFVFDWLRAVNCEVEGFVLLLFFASNLSLLHRGVVNN